MKLLIKLLTINVLNSQLNNCSIITDLEINTYTVTKDSWGNELTGETYVRNKLTGIYVLKIHIELVDG